MLESLIGIILIIIVIVALLMSDYGEIIWWLIKGLGIIILVVLGIFLLWNMPPMSIVIFLLIRILLNMK
jgi:hypothetical protein